MLESKLITPALVRNKSKETSTTQAWLAFVLMSQCGNNNRLAFQYGGFCTMWSFVAKGLLIDLSRIPLQCVRTMAPERGSSGHFHTFTVFLSIPTSTRCHCLLECGKGLLLKSVHVYCPSLLSSHVKTCMFYQNVHTLVSWFFAAAVNWRISRYAVT